jgi:TonB family protein
MPHTASQSEQLRIPGIPEPEFPVLRPRSMHKLLSLLLICILFLPALAQDKPYRVGDGVTPPKLIEKTEPQYTQQAKDAGIEGSVQMSAVISKEGVAEEIKVVKGLDPGLDKNAIAAVQQWKFEPGTKDGKPVRVIATIEVNFRLN